MTRRSKTTPGTTPGSFAADVRSESEADLYFHVAPDFARDSILTHGLDHNEGEDSYPHLEYPRGNYLFKDLDAASEYAQVRAEEDLAEYGLLEAATYDVYEVRHDGPVEKDPFHDDESGLGQSSVYTLDPIKPTQIQQID